MPLQKTNQKLRPHDFRAECAMIVVHCHCLPNIHRQDFFEFFKGVFSFLADDAHVE